MTIDYSHAREMMVEQQVRPWDVLDARVLDTLATLPREAFVPEQHRALAYADIEIPLGHGQRMMKPVVEGRTLQGLKVQAHEDVLEIGTGSGYFSACLGALARGWTPRAWAATSASRPPTPCTSPPTASSTWSA